MAANNVNQNPDVNTPQGNMKPTQGIDGGVSARSKGLETENPEVMEFGEMNERDAMESGYTTEGGDAVSMAKGDVEGSPTGAYTDVGEGRSSAVNPAKGNYEEDEESPDSSSTKH